MSEPLESPHESEDRDADVAALSSGTVTRLFREHNRALVRYLTARLRSEHEAKEVAQEAYVRLLQLHKPGTLSLFRAYLFKTASNLAIDRMRRRAVRLRTQDLDMFDELTIERDAAENPEQQLLSQELSRQLQLCLQELSVKCREVFQLHRLEGLDQREVARRLGFSDRMVRRYVTYAMVYCRLRMDGVPMKQARKLVTL
jgi:RNA polymerase sigma factor (sigma-70 family)